MRYLKIKSIKKIGKRNCYDLQVPGNNNFFLANGILSHNSGKTWKMISIVQYYLEHKHKVFDFFGGKRGEGPFWCFPSDEKRMWDEFQQYTGEMASPGPKEYNVDLIYPYFEQNMPDELPEQLPRIKSKLMTIYFKDITLQDIALVLGDISASGKYIWNTVVKSLPDNANGEDILNLFKHGILKKQKDALIFKLFIEPLCEAKILSGKNGRFNLNLAEESKAVDRVFVLTDDYTPQPFKLFIMGHLIRMLFFETIMQNKTHKLNIALFREMSLFMKVQDASVEDAVQKQVMRNLVTDIARYARSGLFIAGETQSPNETKGIFSGADDLLFITEMPSPVDREELCGQLKRDRRMSDQQIIYLSMMPIDQMAVVTRGNRAKLVRHVQPPRNKCWKQGDPNFIGVYKKIINSFKNINPDKELVENDYKERLFLIEEQLAKEQQLKSGNEVEEEREIEIDVEYAEDKEDNKEDDKVELADEVEVVDIRNDGKLVPKDEKVEIKTNINNKNINKIEKKKKIQALPSFTEEEAKKQKREYWRKLLETKL